MKGLLKRLYDRFYSIPDGTEESVLSTKDEADRAVRSAMEDLQAARARAPEVAALVARSQLQLRLNHVGQLAELTMRGNG